MLRLAYTYKDKLNQEYQKIAFNDKYKYYINDTYWSYNINVSDSSWNYVQMVSVDKDDNVIGYMSACCDRSKNQVTGLSILNFRDLNYTFSKDLYTFLDLLFTKEKFMKMEWLVIVGNPAEAMYDRLVKKYGGNIIGSSHLSTKLPDGEYYDVKYYELMRDDYIGSLK